MRTAYIYLLLIGMLFCTSCLKDKCENCDTNYPVEVNKIITTQCARSGCHDATSHGATGGFDMSTWEKMFNGTNNGAAVVPYSTKFSPLLYFVNTDTLEGLIGKPTMPFNLPALSKSQYHILRDWIAAGAPDDKGFVKFSDNLDRKKIYVSNQGCDNIAIFDYDSRVIMRYIEVGTIPGASPPETPHSIKVTPDNKYLLVIFSGANQGFMQVYDTRTDTLVKNIPIGFGSWNTFTISSDSRRAYVADYANGMLVFVDLENLVTISSFNTHTSLHGVALNSTDDTLYVGQNASSGLFKFPVYDISNFSDIDLNAVQPAAGNLMPHEIDFSHDGSMYFVTCEGSAANQVRAYNTANDQLVKVFNVGLKPVEMSISVTRNLLFVTCMEDNYFPSTTGSVRVIDLTTMTEIKKINVGWQPHDLDVDDKSDLVFVADRNYGGPAPHHAAACAGQNGYFVAINMKTLELVPGYKAELSVDPYSITIKE